MSIHMPVTPADADMPNHPAPRAVEGRGVRGGLLPAITAVWALTSLLMLAICWSRVATMKMWDADDYMRLAEVRDWIGGQSFFDITQYRFNPPQGFSMHWSRIVDVPIAFLTLSLTPLIGSAMGERVAVTLVPMLILWGVMAGSAVAVLRLADRRAALVGSLIAATTPLILFYMLPLRIDHHGWQVLLAVLTLAACFDPRPGRAGVLAGLACATWLAISLEGLPMVTAIALVHGMRFAVDGRRFAADRTLRNFLLSLGLATPGWLVALHGPAAFGRSYGDMLSLAWLGPLTLAPLAAAPFVSRVAERGVVARLSLLIAAAITGVAALLLIDPDVLSGPFKRLDPLVVTFWYNNVSEGLPIWKQSGDTMMVVATFPIVGLAGTLLAWKAAPNESTRRNWLAMFLLALAAFAVSLFVQRAGAVAHAYVLPGVAVLLAGLLGKVAAWQNPVRRVTATVAAILLCSPMMTASAGMGVLAIINPEPPAPTRQPSACAAPCDAVAALNRLPPAYILASLDFGPRMLIDTHHRYLAGGYHRNVTPIHNVIATFTSPPEFAHRLMIRQGMTYLLIDPAGNEANIYSNHAPDGLMARLRSGRAPSWLEPVPLPHSPYRLWRLIG